MMTVSQLVSHFVIQSACQSGSVSECQSSLSMSLSINQGVRECVRLWVTLSIYTLTVLCFELLCLLTYLGAFDFDFIPVLFPFRCLLSVLSYIRGRRNETTGTPVLSTIDFISHLLFSSMLSSICTTIYIARADKECSILITQLASSFLNFL